MKKLFCCFLVFYSVFLQVFAQDQREKKLQTFVKKVLEQVEIVPSVSIAVVKDQKMVFAQGFGYADREKKILATSQTQYYIASCTKSFTGLLACILAEEGKIDLNKPILDYKPFKNFKKQAIFQDITVLDLLRHQSGIKNDPLGTLLAYTGDYNEETILRIVENDTQKREKGKLYDYSNIGYYLFSLILNYEIGKDWRDLLNRRIFKPLKMKKTTAYMSKTNKNNFAMPYIGVFPDKIQKSYLFKANETMHAAGGLVSTAEDIAQFLSFYINKGNLHGKPVYDSSLIRYSYTQLVETPDEKPHIFEQKQYGIGWHIGKFREKEVVYHFGGYAGYFSHISFLPKEKVGVVVVSNLSSSNQIANFIAQYAYDLYTQDTFDEAKYEQELLDVLAKLKQRQEKQLENEKNLASRLWNLSLARQEYTGIFKNEDLGTLNIELEGENFIFSLGKLRSIATAYPDPDCFRLEFVPASGEVICLKPENGKINTITYQGKVFRRVE